MKNYNYIFISFIVIIAGLSFYSCDSPIDVDANRIKIEDTLAIKSLIEITPSSINFGIVNRYQDYEKTIRIRNLSNQSFKISKLFFKNKPKDFIISNIDEFTLAPKNEEGSERYLTFKLRANNVGNITDTLYVNNIGVGFTKVSAICPAVYITDLDFGNVEMNTTVYKAINIYNFTDKPITLTNLKIIGDTSAFKIENFSMPVELIPQYPKQFLVSFSPKKDAYYYSEYDFEIDNSTSGYVDNISIIKGMGK